MNVEFFLPPKLSSTRLLWTFTFNTYTNLGKIKINSALIWQEKWRSSDSKFQIRQDIQTKQNFLDWKYFEQKI